MQRECVEGRASGEGRRAGGRRALPEERIQTAEKFRSPPPLLTPRSLNKIRSQKHHITPSSCVRTLWTCMCITYQNLVTQIERRTARADGENAQSQQGFSSRKRSLGPPHPCAPSLHSTPHHPLLSHEYTHLCDAGDARNLRIADCATSFRAQTVQNHVVEQPRLSSRHFAAPRHTWSTARPIPMLRCKDDTGA